MPGKCNVLQATFFFIKDENFLFLVFSGCFFVVCKLCGFGKKTARKGNKPLVFVIGDSTVHNKDEKSSEDSWGWGSLLANFLDDKKINVENDAMAGRSSRTFIDEGRWDAVCAALKSGDYLFIQFGHNDGSAINTEKARGTIPGNGDESKVYKMETTKRYQVVHSYGWYIRKYIRDARLKGAVPIVVSPVPRDRWKDGKVERNDDSYGLS